MDIFELVFPKYCSGCRQKGSYICDACFESFRPTIQPRIRGFNCLWRYRNPLKKIIGTIKYKFAYAVAKELGERVGGTLTKLAVYPKNMVLVPIPLHTKRKNWRGFNQTEEIGKVVVNRMGWEIEPDLLQKTTNTPPQVGLGREERTSNLKGVFEVNKNSKLKKNTPILLFDDVWTTGSTMIEASRILKKSGFTNIRGLTIAR